MSLLKAVLSSDSEHLRRSAQPSSARRERRFSAIAAGTLWPSLALAIAAVACGGTASPDAKLDPGGPDAQAGVGGSLAGGGAGVGGIAPAGGGAGAGGIAPAGGGAGAGGIAPAGGGAGAGGSSGASDAGGVSPGQGGTAVTMDLPAEGKQALARAQADLGAVANLTAEQFAARYAVSFTPKLGYDPSTSVGLDRIQASTLALNTAELAKLKELGFVVTERLHYPSYTHGYMELYVQHLPLYVSVDSILEGVHRSYDKALRTLEESMLMGKLDALLSGARGRLASAAPDESRADLDVYFAVAASLLSGKAAAPVAGGDAKLVAAALAAATAQTGIVTVTLFGTERMEDFSQYKPRGHYTRSPELGRYFQAMMWLGRTDFRFLETQTDGTQVLRRRQVAAALALRDVLGDPEMAAYRGIDTVVRAFVGEPDFMTLDQLDRLKIDLGIANAAGLGALSDSALAAALANVGYGRQQILSALVENDRPGAGTFPLSLSFAFLGQRYVIDSHVFSNVVWDRTKAMRMMPSPLDAAFAALGNDEAGSLLSAEIAKYNYAPQLASMRVLADEHGSDFWQANLYNLWLGSLRTLSAAGDVGAGKAAGLPAVAMTEPWARRVLNAQLASWAELRHDTLLYAKQSYTSMAGCAFPDAFVDPYPKFFSALEAFAAHGRDVMAGLPNPTGTGMVGMIQSYFVGLGNAASMLRKMAEAELAGAEFTAEQMAFINDAVKTIKNVCSADIVGTSGWYSRLFLDTLSAYEIDPTIADVHTQPTDEIGNVVGRVLHVGTGMPRTMVVSVDRCGTPSAYVGLVSAYFEKTTPDFQRMTDPEWAAELKTATPSDVAWMTGIVSR
jgi:hypothetical protein